MIRVVTCKREKTVNDLEDEGLILLQDSQDIQAIKEHFGNPEWFDYGCVFVKVEDGDYSEVYGCESSVPYLSEWVDTIDTEWVE
jgi:hypothetical protein